MSLRIDGLGTALPPLSLPQELSAAWSQEAAWGNGRRRLIPAVFLRTGIRRRHSVVLEGDPVRQGFFRPARDAADGGPTTRERMERYAVEAGGLAVRAARSALADAGLLGPPAPPVSHLVTVSCSGFSAPGFDVHVIRELGLDPTVARTHVGFMGCHGALNGLRVARAFAESNPSACVLLCAVEMCSLHYDYRTETARILANALFADGAAALVARAGDGRWCHRASGSAILPASEDQMTWSIGDHGFEMGLSPRVPDTIAAHLRPWLTRWLEGNGLALADVSSWAVHPGGPKILDAVEETLGIPREATRDSRAVLEECGNMSSPTVLFILDRLRRRDAPRPCVALGFGPGLAAEAALFL
ncbi:MAG TPA: type III polyketide synthase [Planctomycetota bacterium]|nr:type III polyketide synthase [Planctomycetota bacterium]